jgi:hypothetical protein
MIKIQLRVSMSLIWQFETGILWQELFTYIFILLKFRSFLPCNLYFKHLPKLESFKMLVFVPNTLF